MTNSEPTSADSVRAFEDVAEIIGMLRPEVVAAVIRAASESDAAVAARVRAASGRIVEALTLVAAVSVQEPTVPDETPAEQQSDYRPTPLAVRPVRKSPYVQSVSPDRQEIEQPRNDLYLSQEEVDAKLDEYLSMTEGGEIHLPALLRGAFGESRVSSRTYYFVLRRLESDKNVEQVGKRRYRLIPGKVFQTLNHYTQLDLWSDEEADRWRNEDMTVTNESEGTSEIEPVQVLENLDESDSIHVEKSEENEAVDWDELVAITARWTGRRTWFTARELREHLLSNEAVAPDDVKGSKISTLLKQLRPDIDQYYAERGDKVVWLDDRTYPEAVEAVTGKATGSGPVIFVLGFQPRPDAPPTIRKSVHSRKTADPQVLKSPPETLSEVVSVRPVETQGQRERNITDDQITEIVSIVKDAGGRIATDSLLDILTDPEEGYGLDTEDAQARIGAAMAASRLYRRGIAGKYKGVSIEPRGKGKGNVMPAPEKEMTTETVEAEVERYLVTVRAVMSTIMPLHPSAGLPYNKLWNKNKEALSRYMDFDEFKIYCRRLRDDGVIEIPGDVKLHTKTPHSQKRIGSKVIVPEASRKRWRSDKKTVLSELHDTALDRLIK